MRGHDHQLTDRLQLILIQRAVIRWIGNSIQYGGNSSSRYRQGRLSMMRHDDLNSVLGKENRLTDKTVSTN